MGFQVPTVGSVPATMDEIQLPDELPKRLRQRCRSFGSNSAGNSEQSPHRFQPQTVQPSSSIAVSSAEGWCCRLDSKDFAQAEHDDATGHAEELESFNMLHRLDDIINRLMKSCNGKREDFAPPVSSLDNSLNPHLFEQRLDNIIHRLSQRGQLGIAQTCGACPSSPSIKSLAANSPAKGEAWASSSIAGSSGKASNTERIDPGASPSKKSSSSGRSGRFISVLSLLASPRRLSMQSPGLKSGSPKLSSQEGYMDR